jgi:hypothetical protein
MDDYSKQLLFVSQCEDAKQLRLLMKNARDRGVSVVGDAAFRKLISLVPSERPGTVEHDFWQTIHAFELVLTEERGKTTRLSRTRQKVGRVGVIQTLRDWALSDKETDRFRMLLEREMPELTGEAIILRHRDRFTAEICAAAQDRLTGAGVDIHALSAAG